MAIPLILDPIAASLVRPAIIRSPRISPEPERYTLYADGSRNVPAVRLTPGETTVFQLPLAAGEDAPQILAYLNGLVSQFAQAPYVREFTVELLGSEQVGNNDQEKQVETVLRFVRHNIVYVRDPIDSEYVISPINLLEKIVQGKRPAADCEDHVLLLNSMLGSIGFPTKFVATRINGADWWNHVISSVYCSGRWWELDPCAKGIAQPDYYVRLEGKTYFAM